MNRRNKTKYKRNKINSFPQKKIILTILSLWFFFVSSYFIYLLLLFSVKVKLFDYELFLVISWYNVVINRFWSSPFVCLLFFCCPASIIIFTLHLLSICCCLFFWLQFDYLNFIFLYDFYRIWYAWWYKSRVLYGGAMAPNFCYFYFIFIDDNFSCFFFSS